MRAALGETEVGLSAVTIAELTHGIYRAKTDADRKGRQSFTDELCRDVPVHPVTLEVAQLAGKIEGEQAARGISIAFEDLLIGTTALHIGWFYLPAGYTKVNIIVRGKCQSDHVFISRNFPENCRSLG